MYCLEPDVLEDNVRKLSMFSFVLWHMYCLEQDPEDLHVQFFFKFFFYFDTYLACAREEQDVLENKLAAIQKKIIVGGENLLEKAEEQERMLEESARELEERKQKEDLLRKQLEEKEVSFCLAGCGLWLGCRVSELLLLLGCL